MDTLLEKDGSFTAKHIVLRCRGDIAVAAFARARAVRWLAGAVHDRLLAFPRPHEARRLPKGACVMSVRTNWTRHWLTVVGGCLLLTGTTNLAEAQFVFRDFGDEAGCFRTSARSRGIRRRGTISTEMAGPICTSRRRRRSTNRHQVRAITRPTAVCRWPTAVITPLWILR